MDGGHVPRATDLHRVYIQSLLSRRAMTEDVALEMYKRAVGAVLKVNRDFVPAHPRNAKGLEEFLEEVSGLLESSDMIVRRGREGKHVWVVLCNTEGGDMAQHATDLSPLEITYYRIVVEAIVTSYPAYSISTNNALHQTTLLESTMRRADAETLLGALVSRGWLSKSKRGRYSLAPRALLELDHYLRETYDDDVRNCAHCRKLMMSGVACANENCTAHYHQYCYERIMGSRPRCRSCRVDFNQVKPNPIGEGTVSRNEDDWVGAGRRKRRRTENGGGGGGGGGDDDDEDVGLELEEEEGEEDELESPSQSQSQSQTQTQQRRGQVRPSRPSQVLTQEEDDDDEQPGPSRRRGGPRSYVPDSVVDESL